VALELTFHIGILPRGLHRSSFPSNAKGQSSHVLWRSLWAELAPPFHRLPLGRFADSSPSSSRTLDTTYGFDSVWIISMGHQRFIFRSPFQLAPAWLFSSYSRPASLGPQPHCLVL